MSHVPRRLAQARALESLVRNIARSVILPHYLNTTRTQKTDGSLLTEADLESQRRFCEALPTFLPGAVLGEEMTTQQQISLWSDGKDGMWCIDPIDGTTNFVNGIPFFAVSVAYLIDHKPYLGVVYNPVTDESFCAAKDAGAYLNRVRLPLRRPATRLADAVAGIDFKRIPSPLGDHLANQPPYYSQRNFGSSALEWCFVAAGRLDIYVHGGQMLWDHMAGQLILAEAGGQASALSGNALTASPAAKQSVVAAGSDALFTEWLNWLKRHC